MHIYMYVHIKYVGVFYVLLTRIRLDRKAGSRTIHVATLLRSVLTLG